jgi:hypothetical protein
MADHSLDYTGMSTNERLSAAGLLREWDWSRHLAVDGKSHLKQGLRYLEETRDTAFRVEPPQE